MTQEQFLPYHNYHIQFRLNNGAEMSGVLFFNHMSAMEHKPHTSYFYIPTLNMIEWKHAEKDKDEVRMKNLRGEIDISNIIWARRLQ